MSNKIEGPEFFSSHEEMQRYYGELDDYGNRMHLDYVHEHHETFIKHSPLVVLATVDKDGFPTASPKGDPKGFVQVFDAKTLLVPDRPGNNRLETLHNLMDQPKIGLLFVVPGIPETLRIRGSASITRETKFLEACEVKGKMPRSVMKIHVEETYLHCGKAIRRSKIWDQEQQVPRQDVPTIAKMMVDQSGPIPGKTLEQLEEHTEVFYRETLY